MPWPVFNVPLEQLIELWQQVTCRVLIINADDGFEHRVGQDDTVKYFRSAQLVNIADAGHWTYHDQLDKVVDAINAFPGDDSVDERLGK